MHDTSITAEPVNRGQRWLRRLPRLVFALLLGLFVISGLSLAILNTHRGQAWLLARLAEQRTESGMSIAIAAIHGDPLGSFTASRVVLSDHRGVWARLPSVRVRWSPWALWRQRIVLSSLSAPRMIVLRRPELLPTRRSFWSKVRNANADIADIDIDRLDLDPAVVGRAQSLRLSGATELEDRRLRVVADLVARTSGDLARLRLRAEPDVDGFDLALAIDAPPDGVLARLARLRQGFAVTIAGDGHWRRWAGALSARLGGREVVALNLTQRGGAMTASGALLANETMPKLANWLIGRTSKLQAAARLDEGVLDATFDLKGERGRLAAEGRYDADGGQLAAGAMRLTLPDTLDLLPGARGHGVALTARPDGPLDALRAPWTLAVDRIERGPAYVLGLNASGRASRTSSGLTTSLDARASRVAGVSARIDPHLVDLHVAGGVTVDSRLANLRLSAVRLSLPDGELTADGDLSLPHGIGALTVTGALRPVDMAGIVRSDLRGQGRLVSLGLGERPRFTGRVDAPNVVILNQGLRQLLGDRASLGAAVDYGAARNLHFPAIQLVAPNGRLNGALQLDRDLKLNGRLAAQITSLDRLGIPRSTPVAASLLVDGPLTHPIVSLEARVARLELAGQALRDVTATVTPRTDKDYAVAIMGQSAWGPVRLAANLTPGPTVAVRDIDGRLDVWRLSGRAVLKGASLVSGALRASGHDLTADISAAPAGADTLVTFSAEGDRARPWPGRHLAVGRLRSSATLRLSPGRLPRVDGQLAIDNAVLDDLLIAKLRLTATPTAEGAVLQLTANGERGQPFNLSAAGRADDRSAALTLKGRIADLAIATTSPLQLGYGANGLLTGAAALAVGGGSLALSGHMRGSERALDLRIDGLNLQLLEPLVHGLNLSGLASGRLALAMPDGGRPRGGLSLTVKGLRRSGLTSASVPVDTQITGELTDRTGSLAMSTSVGGRSVGQASLTTSTFAYRPGVPSIDTMLSTPVSGVLGWSGPAEALWTLTALEGHDLAGPVSINASVAGTLREPSVSGSAASTALRYENLKLGTVVRDIRFDARFNGPQVTLVSLTGKAGKRGSVEVTGQGELSVGKHFPALLDIAFSDAEVINRDDFEATGTGRVQVRYGPEGGSITGGARLTRSRFRLGSNLVQPTPPLAVEERGGAFQPAEPYRRAIQPWTVALDASMPERFALDGRGLVSEWRGAVKMSGSLTAPAAVGRLDLIRGTYTFAGRRFDLDHGIITFDGGIPDPRLDIVAASIADSTTVQINIAGTATHPVISFSSNPSLPQDEILARLLYGSSIKELGPADAIQLASAVASLQNNGGRNLDLFGQAQRLTGIDRIRVLPPDPKRRAGTAFAGGKYITDRVYVEVRTDGNGYSATAIELDLTRTLSILSEIATLGGTNAAIRWSRDY